MKRQHWFRTPLEVLEDRSVPSVGVGGGLIVDDVTISEGHSGVRNAIFTVSRLGPALETATVSYHTNLYELELPVVHVPGCPSLPYGSCSIFLLNNLGRMLYSPPNAWAGIDYTPVNGTLTFNPGETSKSISVPILGDTMYEPDEFFTLQLYDAQNAVILDDEGLATISNDDSRPVIRIRDASMKEGNRGELNMAFTVELSNPSFETITVNYATSDGTAKAGSDYHAISGRLTFQPGETTKTIWVSVIGDRLKEANEMFYINLSDADGADIDDAQAAAWILDDDTK